MTTHDRPLSSVVPAGRPRRWAQLRRRSPELIKAPVYWVYQKRLERQVATWNLPRHIGVIMDGNRRYARELGFSHISSGHLSGAEKLWEVLSWCYELGVPVVTVWSFSLDNFERDTSEVEALLGLFEEKTKELAEHEEVHQKEVRVRYLGEIARLPQGLRNAIGHAEQRTACYSRFQLNIAMAYGGREEILEAFRGYLRSRRRAHVHRPGARCRLDRALPLHLGPARARPDPAHQRRGPPERLPALAERVLRVLLLRCQLARAAQDRPAARPAVIPPPTPPARAVVGGRPRGEPELGTGRGIQSGLGRV